MNFLILLLQNTGIDQKLKDAPDSNYGIGVFIGTILPFVILVIIAYMLFTETERKDLKTIKWIY